MAGFRVGFAAGNKDMIDHLATIKGYYDYGIFTPIQISGIIALRHCEDAVLKQREEYQRRRDVLCDGLERIATGEQDVSTGRLLAAGAGSHCAEAWPS